MNATHFKRAWHLLVIQVGVVVLAPDGNCSTNDAENARYPAVLVKAAQAFKSTSPTNRYPEAKKVWEALPKCPLISEKDIGSGVLRNYDYSRPSYVLSSKDVLVLLGEPLLAKTNATGWTFYYLISGTPPDKSRRLSIDFRNDRVVLSYLRGPIRLTD